MTHAIIIGGTGMLAKACRVMASYYDQLTLISRRPHQLALELGVESISMNWEDQRSVSAAVRIIEKNAPVHLLVSWLHDEGVWCLPKFEQCLSEGARSIRIHSSAVGDPSNGVKNDPPAPKSIIRQNVVLGWVEQDSGRRWLTNDEISQGVITAFQNPEKLSLIVGQVR